MTAPTTTKLTCTKTLWDRCSNHPCGRTARRDKGQNNEPRCGIHSSEAVQRRRDKSQAKWAAERRGWDRQRAEQKAAKERIDRLDKLAEEAKMLTTNFNSIEAREIIFKLAKEAKP